MKITEEIILAITEEIASTIRAEEEPLVTAAMKNDGKIEINGKIKLEDRGDNDVMVGVTLSYVKEKVKHESKLMINTNQANLFSTE